MIKTNIGGTNVIDIFILILNIDSSTPQTSHLFNTFCYYEISKRD